jgi:hypothetical protein
MMDLPTIATMLRLGTIKVTEVYGLYKEFETYKHDRSPSVNPPNVIDSTAVVVEDLKALPAPVEVK